MCQKPDKQKLMKAISVCALIVGFLGFNATAQNSNKKSNYPYYTISKEAARLPFKNIEHVPAKITLVSPAVTQSKGNVKNLMKVESEERKVTRVGYPAWTISKAVARRQYEKSQSK